MQMVDKLVKEEATEGYIMKGLMLLNEGKTEEGVKYISLAASKENAEAMYNLAILHEEGRGVKKDVLLAKNLLEKTVKQPVTKDGKRNVGKFFLQYKTNVKFVPRCCGGRKCTGKYVFRRSWSTKRHK